ncbi:MULTISPECIES: hypothetical protein [unclassified Sphingobacterium]|uniref:hypothetical protein n=1 Tax=unclassified Sphingobacterium TaxID=2609468 RepID=UPI0025F9A5E8|nr:MULTISPECIES: hypothetical protein [unclassified Sphingobacterium]
MSKDKYTHIAKIYGIPCYFNEENMAIEGTNWFYEKLIDLAIYLDTILKISDGFYITDMHEINKAD